MRRCCALAVGAVATAVLLLAPGSAQARPACAAETKSPTDANRSQVSDAIFCLTNAIRATYALPALRRDTRLDTSSRLHSEDMAANGYFSHTGQDGSTPGSRAAAQGYTFGVGENIAAGHDNARAAMEAWMSSSGHCRNILSSARDIGVGTAVAAGPHYTLVFGDYFSVPVNDAPAAGCPYTIDLSVGVTPEPPGSGPALTGLKLSPRRFRAGKKSTVSYSVSEAAALTFRVERAVSGRRVGGTCVKRTPANARAPRCTRYATLAGSLTRSAKQGANSFGYHGRLNAKRLKPGRYRLRAVAVGTAGTSATRRASFRILTPKS